MRLHLTACTDYVDSCTTFTLAFFNDIQTYNVFCLFVWVFLLGHRGHMQDVIDLSGISQHENEHEKPPDPHAEKKYHHYHYSFIQ